MSQHSITVDGVSKKFGLTLKAALKYGLVDSFRRTTGRGKDEYLRKGEFWALKDVDFALDPGDALGIMGVNGSGKTTLLRILNGTFTPDEGRVTMRGRIGALIAAGAGFSPMLSGRENVFISGTLLGMAPKDISRRFDEIVAFADLGEFIDMPVRNYSSGMTVRLGFAVAVLGRPEILLVDEVLAVGDIAFQKKCYERIYSLRNEGVTILFVSHSVGAVWAVCNKGLFLDHGNCSGVISPEDLCKLYGQANYTALQRCIDTAAQKSIPTDYSGQFGGTGEAEVESLEICNVDGLNVTEIEFGDTLILKMHVKIHSHLKKAMFRYSIDAVHYKYIFDTDSSYAQGMGLVDVDPGQYVVTTKIEKQTLRPGVYTVNLAVLKKELGVHVYFQSAIKSFIVKHPLDRFMVDAFDSPAIVYFESHFAISEI